MSRGDLLNTGKSPSKKDATSAKLKWKFLTSNRVALTPVVADDVVFIGAYDSTFYAIQRESGRLLWQAPARGPEEKYSYSVPAIADDRIVAATETGLVTAFARADGKVVWQRQMPAAVFSSLRYFDGKLFFGCLDNFFYALDAKNGETVWRYECGDHVGSSCAITRSGKIYFPSHDKNLYCLNAADGSLIKKFEIGLRSTGQPAITSGCLYMCTTGREFACYDLLDGSKRWKQESLTEHQQGVGVGEDTVYVHIGKFLWAYDALKGSLRWKAELDGSGSVAPCVGVNYVYIADQKGMCYAIDMKSGERRWKFQMEQGGVWSAPVLIDGVVFVGDGAGYLYAIE